MSIPFKEHLFSAQDCEFVLATRKFYPRVKHVIVVAVGVGILTFFGGIDVGYGTWISTSIAVGVAIVSLGAAPVLFFWRTGQLGVENYLLGNIRSVMGHVNWPPIWQNVFAERAVTYDWADIELVVLRPAPWSFALNNLNLDLYFHDRRERVLRVPHLKPEEAEAFAEVLQVIALRRGFRFQKGYPVPPLSAS